jgi:CHASE1-domain containing sensor protein
MQGLRISTPKERSFRPGSGLARLRTRPENTAVWRRGHMARWKIRDAGWSWAVLVLLVAATARAGRDGLVALFRSVFGGMS